MRLMLLKKSSGEKINIAISHNHNGTSFTAYMKTTKCDFEGKGEHFHDNY